MYVVHPVHEIHRFDLVKHTQFEQNYEGGEDYVVYAMDFGWTLYMRYMDFVYTLYTLDYVIYIILEKAFLVN